MLETRLLRRVIHWIWECHRDKRAIRFYIQNYNGDELRVEEHVEASTVTVRYFAKQPSDELLKLMDVTCFILEHGEWIPLDLTADGITIICGTGDPETDLVIVTDQKSQAIAAGLSDAWALLLLENGFLAAAARYQPFGTRPPQISWPEPTILLPSLEQLEDWRWEDGGCEATDGCWVAYDTVCPHGHPSWLLRLDLV